MNIIKEQIGKVLNVALEGRLDTTTAPQLEQELKNYFDSIEELNIEQNKIDLLIVDEIDAFPYNGSLLLETMLKRSLRGHSVMMSATPSKEVIEYISKQFTKDLNTPEGELVSLLGKWLPSINTSSELARASARKLAKAFGMNNGEYRKATAKLRNRIKIIENYLREKDYSFDYSKQTSYSMLKYRKAFIRNDKERYQDYINAVNMGFAKLNTKVLYPYDVVRPLIVGDVRNVSKEEKESLNFEYPMLSLLGMGYFFY